MVATIHATGVWNIGISMGSALLSTHAADWLARQISVSFGLSNMSVFMVFAILALFLIVIHIGFASATAVASSMIPIIIAVLQSLQELHMPDLNIVAITMVLQFVVSFGFILPVNSPQGILAFATETFSVRDCMIIGLPLTIIGYLLLLAFAGTYWKMLGVF